ncbi:M23 family metallopeptidase [Neosynechococcus sphagnicola]|uniref:M23 family metallopeptidase n=1 Tax=Neosynechococcus sphagnicola TaxID=1501145 RepID=UPI000AD8D2A1|nr:M23 family metallopeptidase [Neosynechococcus sphagnicola]
MPSEAAAATQPLKTAPTAAAPPNADWRDPYIDPTPYNLGATPYQGPETVILSERASGCQIVLQGSHWHQPCGSAPAAAVSQPPWSGQASAGASGHGGNLAAVSSTVLDYYNRSLRPAGRLGNGNINLLFPLSIPAAITSAFGWRIHPITGEQRFHSGTDLGAPLGTPVLAAYAGQVEIADFLDGYGLTVILNHNQYTQKTLYGHLSEIFVKPGEQVQQGMVIGRVGSTGNSTGPHLHFEFQQLTPEGWVALDPGAQLEYALAQLLKVLQVAQKPVTPSS